MTGRRAVVVGLGVSGVAAAQALLRHGTRVVATDERDDDTVAAAAAGLQAAGVACRLGPLHDPAPLLAEADLVVPSPGVPQHHALLGEALARGIPVLSEPGLAWELAAGATRLVGVTGTNGKTTTTEMVAACLDAPAAGNIGAPLVDLLDPRSGTPTPALVVVELSSFQLRFAGGLRPDVAALLNLAADHLDWHGSLAAYAEAKARLWRQQRPGDWVVVNGDDPGARRAVAEHPPPGGVTTYRAGPPGPGEVGVDGGAIVARLDGAPVPVVAVDALTVRGPHDLGNACAAVAVALRAGAAPAALAGPLRRYRPGRHRLETVGEFGGVRYVDDSKATNPHAAAAALAACADGAGTVVWIAGGLGKGLSFDELRDVVARTVRAAVTVGTNGPDIARVARNAGVEVVEAHTLPAAVAAAVRLARPGDTVLLAPACASMDQFTSYAHRGEEFRAAVARLAPAAHLAGGVAGGD